MEKQCGQIIDDNSKQLQKLMYRPNKKVEILPTHREDQQENYDTVVSALEIRYENYILKQVYQHQQNKEFGADAKR